MHFAILLCYLSCHIPKFMSNFLSYIVVPLKIKKSLICFCYLKISFYILFWKSTSEHIPEYNVSILLGPFCLRFFQTIYTVVYFNFKNEFLFFPSYLCVFFFCVYVLEMHIAIYFLFYDLLADIFHNDSVKDSCVPVT